MALSAWLQKPSQWRWPSGKRSLVLMGLLLALALVGEGLLLAGRHQPFLLRGAMQLRAQWRGEGGKPQACSPMTLDPKNFTYRSDHGFYNMMKSGLVNYPSPVFRGNATALCDEKATGKARYWDYCLPITGRKDVPYCHGRDRNDLLRPQTATTRCFNSALHMLMVEVYEEMKHVDLHPAMLYGTLLGAIREGLTIPFTEDADIGYNMMDDEERPRRLRAELAKKGYHMFHMGIWRVCIAPTHPLASNLYDPAMELLDDAMEAPYVDLYEMKLENETTWRVAEAYPNALILRDKIEPFSQVTLHGMKYDTVADPHYFLKREYGEDYMTPKPRTPKPTKAK